MARKDYERWPNSERFASGTLVWTSEASRGLNRVSHFKGIFFNSQRGAKGVEAFHDNVLFD